MKTRPLDGESKAAAIQHAIARLEVPKTGRRTVWLGPEAHGYSRRCPRSMTGGVPPRPHIASALYLLVRRPRGGGTPRSPHPGYPPYLPHLGLAERHERRRANCGGTLARIPQAPHHRHLDEDTAGCHRPGRHCHRRRDGLKGRAAAIAGRNGRRVLRLSRRSCGSDVRRSHQMGRERRWLRSGSRRPRKTQPKYGRGDQYNSGQDVKIGDAGRCNDARETRRNPVPHVSCRAKR